MNLTLSNKLNWELCLEDIARRRVPPLHWAVRHTALDLIEMLLSSGVDINTVHRGNTPLVDAASLGFSGIIARLLSNPHLDMKQHKQGMRALWRGIENGHPSVVQGLLCSDNVDANIVFLYRGEFTTPLTYAVTRHSREMVETLLADRRTDPNFRYKNTPAPFFGAMRAEYLCLAQRLMSDERFDVTVCCSCGGNPLHHAAETGCLHILQILLSDFDIDINAQDADGFTALIYAAAEGHESIVRELLSHSLDINRRDHRGRTALWWATNNGHEWAARCLLARSGIRVDAIGEDGSTSLHHAVRWGSATLINLLLTHRDINVNVSDDYGRTPLWWAAYHGNGRAVEYLLHDSGAKVDIQDRWQQGPLEVARDHGQYYIWLALRVSMIDVRLFILCAIVVFCLFPTSGAN
ncbi:ankyrin repeat domain-containing protein [Aspergillus melleus]|uniref:ankyrin repeat domain-containing protein n=1 Tax=Aspergillus melleus TaxID=138277 RepID=UPI001E8DC8C9|nr:Ankyrin repeat domain-containing protein 16 [Aspergillus melleus]KAH8430205.1 Ankyrin repeat domain-containing protein 16 [Aspergillus melleus]